MKAGFDRRRVGEVRPTQMIHTFGVGSLVDLPNFSAIVMGLDEWDPPTPQSTIGEERLLALVRSHLGPQVERLAAPPVRSDEGGRYDPFDPETKKGVPVSPFPRWVRCPVCDLIAPLDFGVFGLKDDPWRPDRTRYVHENCQKARGAAPAVVPVRFLRVCEHGHLADFPWLDFVHGGNLCSAPLLRLHEFGVSAEAADISVKCDACGTGQPMVNAFGEEGEKRLGKCGGRHPHLRSVVPSCEAKVKATLAGASNLWFGVNVASLSIPSGQGKLERLVGEEWASLEPITSPDILAAFRKAGHLHAFAEWSNEELWAAIEARRERKDDGGPQKASVLRRAEWNVFSEADPSKNEEDFQLSPVDPPGGYEGRIDKVVLVERLRVVKALVGFTRVISPGDFADVSEIPEIRRVPLARSRPTWVPAAEVRGEGIFIQFREDVLREWIAEQTVRGREQAFFEAHRDFRKARKIEPPEGNFPRIRYVLLHSLAHALMRQFSLECGYGAASLQERVYAWDETDDSEPMGGILLYTAAADSEGTLGGLVSLGQPRTLARHLDHGLEAMRFCASDPLCAEHVPGEEGITLHGGACHACLFAPETACERGNKYLDRTLLVETVGGTTAPFFPST